VPRPGPIQPTFFATPSALRAWLEEHHGRAAELWVGFHKKGSGRPSVTWPQAVDEALCFGWIDGVRRGLGDESYTIRFTPRRPGSSTWSAINIRRAQELIASGAMRPPGLQAFEKRTAENSAIYSYEQRQNAKLDRADEQRFRANTRAWAFFQAQPPGYRRASTHWVVSAKREETRRRRLDTLMADSAAGHTIRPLTRKTSAGARRKPPRR
jgi:uncharacterized protein YdeI (YjbR/CyaY-like superfamily)